MTPLVAFAQSRVEVENLAGGHTREVVEPVLESLSAPLGECFDDATGSVLATLRVSRGGRVASVRFMDESGDEGVDRCLKRTLRGAAFGRGNGRSTIYVRITRE